MKTTTQDRMQETIVKSLRSEFGLLPDIKKSVRSAIPDERLWLLARVIIDAVDADPALHVVLKSKAEDLDNSDKGLDI